MKSLMEIRKSILSENKILTETWYHGTPDAREVEKVGGFTHRTMSVDYVTDVDGLRALQDKMNDARQNDETEYFKLLNQVDNYKKRFTYKKPLFLSDVYSVAKTYANPRRALDYQGAEEKVYEVDVNCNKIAKIVAIGDRFRFISIDKVKRGFINSGVSEDEIDNLIAQFNYYVSNKNGIQTDVIAAIGNWLEFDCIDVVGVLDSHEGGNTKSTVRMVLDPTTVRIKK